MIENPEPQSVESEPNWLKFALWMVSFILLAILIWTNACHATLHAFPAGCATSSCSVARAIAVAGVSFASYCLAAWAVIIATYFIGTLRRHRVSEYIAAAVTVAVTFAGALLTYPAMQIFTHSVGKWAVGLFVELVLMFGGFTAFSAIFVLGLTRPIHPILAWRDKRSGKLNA